MTTRLLAWGLLLVVLDPQLNGLDLLPDVIGWGVALVALVDMGRRSPTFLWAQVACSLALACSGLRQALYFSEEPMAWARVLGELGTTMAWVGVAWLVLTGLAGEAIAHGDPTTAYWLRRLAVLSLLFLLVDLSFGAGAWFADTGRSAALVTARRIVGLLALPVHLWAAGLLWWIGRPGRLATDSAAPAAW
ncbi:hypothetical protein ACTQ49_12070 [Luteococcus sp. Sow4_B9]|uniref:hypothetical protein n=1 Tax=Luteococcus sp. Sow4_B9 TaxID=3438792 RepID=UPI003F9CFA56